MRLLIVEDDKTKLSHIQSAAAAWQPDATVRVARSFRAALLELVTWSPHLVLLDMTLPNYDVTEKDSGGRNRPFGGRDLLQEIKRRELAAKSIVVTGFETFGENRTTLGELTTDLHNQFGEAFLGSVYYHAAQEAWKQQLRELLGKAST